MAMRGESLAIPGTRKPGPVILANAAARSIGGHVATKPKSSAAAVYGQPTATRPAKKPKNVGAKPKPVAKKVTKPASTSPKAKTTKTTKAKSKPAAGRVTTTKTTTKAAGANSGLPGWYQSIINADNAQTTQQANELKALTSQNYQSILGQSTQEQQQLANLAHASGQAWGAGTQMPGVPGSIASLMNQTNATIGADQATVPLVGLNSQAASLMANEPYALSTLYGRNAAAQAKLAATYGAELMKTQSAASLAAFNQKSQTDRAKLAQQGLDARASAADQLKALQLQAAQAAKVTAGKAKVAAANNAHYNSAITHINGQYGHLTKNPAWSTTTPTNPSDPNYVSEWIGTPGTVSALPASQQAAAIVQQLGQYSLSPAQVAHILLSHLTKIQTRGFQSENPQYRDAGYASDLKKAASIITQMQRIHVTSVLPGHTPSESVILGFMNQLAPLIGKPEAAAHAVKIFGHV